LAPPLVAHPANTSVAATKTGAIAVPSTDRARMDGTLSQGATNLPRGRH
jgi:hypothetical protein